LVGVLKGVTCFMADLMRHVALPVSIDFMTISSYEGDRTGAVRVVQDLSENIVGKHVLIVEDIVDTGMTLNHLMKQLRAREPASLAVCALLDKRVRRLVDLPLDYVGFEIPDEFVVGYGLDYRQRFRNLPFIATLRPDEGAPAPRSDVS
jgi:hypoxanthine phosphoribosyltransferase